MKAIVLVLLAILAGCIDTTRSADDPRPTVGAADRTTVPMQLSDDDGTTLPVESAACACETAECIADVIEESAGCGVCAEIVCSDRHVGGCVLCPAPPLSRLRPVHHERVAE